MSDTIEQAAQAAARIIGLDAELAADYLIPSDVRAFRAERATLFLRLADLLGGGVAGIESAERVLAAAREGIVQQRPELAGEVGA